MAPSTEPNATPSFEPDLVALRRAATAALAIGCSVAIVASWLFYDLYWRWRDLIQHGTHVDPAGRVLYAESAVWGVVALAAAAVALLAFRARRSAVRAAPLLHRP
jgi:hypothetical protein